MYCVNKNDIQEVTPLQTEEMSQTGFCLSAKAVMLNRI
jgi:hypothetical protein